MAIDTRAKRASALVVCSRWYPPGILPDGDISSGIDRQQIGWGYTGIPVGAVVGVGEIMVVIRGTIGAVERRVLIDAVDQKRVVIDSANKVAVVQDDSAPPIKVVI